MSAHEKKVIRYQTSSGSIAEVTYTKYVDGWYATVGEDLTKFMLRELGWKEAEQ